MPSQEKTQKNSKIRMGVIGLGGMGMVHANSILENKVSNCVLTAVCENDSSRLAQFGENTSVEKYDDYRKLLKSGNVDAVLIATPHYSHTSIGIDALQKGLHVLVEKPISVHKADCERLISARVNKKQIFAAMFNQRTDPHFSKVRDLVQRGELGRIVRISWIATNWFRPDFYYASGKWRATWRGEGGGVLLNQAIHNIDLMQWICGMPSKITAFCYFGKWHNIEVEDEVTAYMEYKSGATAVFVTSTGEAPGSNRFEICGEMGKVVIEDDVVRFTRNEIPASEYGRTSKQMFSAPDVWNITIPVKGYGTQHVGIMQNFIDAIIDGKPLIAPAEEGINSIEIANAMLFSSQTGKTVELPLDSKAYQRMLKKLIQNSKKK